jgi:hypothetical protein
MEWRWRKFGTLMWYGEGFEPRGFGASKRPREGKKQAAKGREEASGQGQKLVL